jgi:hypothetical protein
MRPYSKDKARKKRATFRIQDIEFQPTKWEDMSSNTMSHKRFMLPVIRREVSERKARQTG